MPMISSIEAVELANTPKHIKLKSVIMVSAGY